MFEKLNEGPLGALPDKDGKCLFRVWAPFVEEVFLVLEGAGNNEIPLKAETRGYHSIVTDAKPGDLYRFRPGKKSPLRPDPASRAQPEGVHGPSMVMDPAFEWTDDNWQGILLSDYVFYEIHIGAFSPEGNFDAAIKRLDYLAELGVTCVEIMPVAAFPGERNWGYDGVQPYAVQWNYGGLKGLCRFVDACHSRGIAVCLDVVYNHLGPVGNYLRDFGPYFTGMYSTPWGEALNFDDRHSDGVRHYFLENIRWWIEDIHIDALRLDAVHAVFDRSAWPFLAEAAMTARDIGERIGRRVHVIAESDLHDPRMVRSFESGGYGMHSEWNDDLHHAVHALLTGERDSYYADFGSVTDLAAVYNKAYAHAGKWSPYRQMRYGASAAKIPGESFVVCIQNHDQTGNRPFGERLASLASFESLKLAAGAMLLSPYLPLLFMGEEYGETNPFLYFTDHGEPELDRAVRKGRAKAFSAVTGGRKIPDPASFETFEQSQTDCFKEKTEQEKTLLQFYRELFRLRREHPCLGVGDYGSCTAVADEKRNAVGLFRRQGNKEILALFNFSEEKESIPVCARPGIWQCILDSSDILWMGPGEEKINRIESDGEICPVVSGRSFMLFEFQE